MEAVPNGEFSSTPYAEETGSASTVEPVKTAFSESVIQQNGESVAAKDVPSTHVTVNDNNSSVESNDIDMTETSKGKSSSINSSLDSICTEAEANLTSSSPPQNCVDSLTLLNNSVQNIPSLFNEPTSSTGEGVAATKSTSASDSHVVDLHKLSETAIPAGNIIDQLVKVSELGRSNNVVSPLRDSEKNDSSTPDKTSEKSGEKMDTSLPAMTLIPKKDTNHSISPLDFSNLDSQVDGASKNNANHNAALSTNIAQNLTSKAGASKSIENDSGKIESSKENAVPKDKENDSDCLVFTELSNEETGFPEMFKSLVTIGKYISVKGDFTLRSSEALVESPSLVAPFLLKEPDTFPVRNEPLKSDARGFFFSAAGELLIGIGLSRVSEWYHKDMAKIKKRLMKKDGKSPQLEDELRIHEEFYAETKKANRFFSFPLKTCKVCGFSTESAIVMEGHLLVPHINSRKEFQCNFCETCNKDPRAILEHMFRAHAKTGRIQPPFSFFECPYCTFESNSKVKLSNHLIKCQRCYDPNRNLAPPKDFEFPTLTPKPITVAVVKAYEKSLSSMQRGRGRPKKNEGLNEQGSPFASVNQIASVGMGPVPNYRPNAGSVLSDGLSNLANTLLPHMQMPNISLRPPPSHPGMNQFRPSLNSLHLPSPSRLFHHSSSPMMPLMGGNSLASSPSQFPFSSSLVNSSKKHSTHSPNIISSLFGPGGRLPQNAHKSPSDMSPPSLPKLQGPYPVPHVKTAMSTSNTSMSGNSLVVCEICDGYIKDLEQLRSHMQLIHKVKIHPKMLVSRPPLNCQKCQWRFFTDQGLERHLLGSHGLVTSNMQELANKGKDAGCCTICGRVYASKLVSHMNQVHKLTLKPAHLSYKCTVCSATFNLYRLFENHVYLVHSGAAKRSSDGSSNPAKRLKSLEADQGGYQSEEPVLKNKLERCKDCGKEFLKMSGKGDRCEKCLNFDGQGLGRKALVS